MRIVTAIASLTVALGCGPSGEPINPCTRTPMTFSYSLLGRPSLDLLLVVDRRPEMAAAREAFARELPRLLGGLRSGVHPSTGEIFDPIRSIRFGVITTDVGGPGCADDAGILQPEAEACGLPHWLELNVGDDPMPFGEAATCALVSGSQACGLVQPLESTLEALLPSTSGVTFRGGTVGQGDGANAGFLRDHSTLVVVALTTNDDCSIADPELLDADSPSYSGPLARRCVDHPEALQPLERFVDGLLWLRQDHPRRAVFMPIVGVPLDLVPDSLLPLPAQARAVLDDPRMQARPDPSDPSAITPSCESPLGTATPPRRLVRASADLDGRGGLGLIASTCGGDLRQAADTLLSSVGVGGWAGCIVRPFRREPDGRVDCRLVERFDPATLERCEALPGRTSLDVDPETGELRCEVHQVAIGPDGQPLDPDRATGWVYDDLSDFVNRYCPDSPQRLAWMGGAEPADGAIRTVRCDGGHFAAPPGVGDPCTDDGDCAVETLEDFRFGLACEPVSGSCLPPCESSYDCPGGWVCFDVDDDGVAYCINPTC